MIWVVCGIAAVIFVMILTSVKTVPPGMVFIVERMGSFYAAYTEGVHYKIPFIDRIAGQVVVSERSIPVESFTAVSNDKIPFSVSVLVRYQVEDARRCFYSITDPDRAIAKLVLGTVRDVISARPAEEADAEYISRVSAEAVSLATENAWGIKVPEIKLTELSKQ